jgi:hypothetical protein
MTPADIVTAIYRAGAQITTDGESITVNPSKLVPPMVMGAAKDAKPLLIAHLIETGRLHAHTAEAAQLVTRLVKGRELLWDMECRGDTSDYNRFLGHFEQMLAQYTAVCDAGMVAA